jgi:RAS protein activator-like 2
MHNERDRVRRVDNALSVWLLEAKSVPNKRRYFCEISIDHTLYARTSAKPHAKEMCFWGESFEFQYVYSISKLH